MNKILTINTIKNVFSALGAKTSDSNYAVGLFDKTSAEPKGIMGMSDLASVLGVIRSTEYILGDSSISITKRPGLFMALIPQADARPTVLMMNNDNSSSVISEGALASYISVSDGNIVVANPFHTQVTLKYVIISFN